MNLRASPRIDKDPTIPQPGLTLEIRTEVRDIRTTPETRQEAGVSCHASSRGINENSRIILSRIRQVRQIKQNQRARCITVFCCGEAKAEKRCMMGGSHIHHDARVHRQSEIAGACADRVVDVSGLSVLLGIDTAVDVVIFALYVGEDGEVSK